MKQRKRVWFVSLGMILFALASADVAEAQKSKSKKKAAAAASKKAAKAPPAPEGGDAAPTSAPPSAAPSAAGSEDSRVLQRGERIEFDARLIQGQTAKAGAVYLFERASSNLRSMVKDRSSFRDRIVRTVFPGDTEAKSDAKEESSP